MKHSVHPNSAITTLINASTSRLNGASSRAAHWAISQAEYKAEIAHAISCLASYWAFLDENDDGWKSKNDSSGKQEINKVKSETLHQINNILSHAK